MAATSIGASPALAVGPGLPPGYQVQPVDPPTATTSARFGNLMTVIGDVNGDTEEDFVTVQITGSLNGDGVFRVYSGATGQLLRSTNTPDNAGAGARALGDSFVGRFSDIGSCANAPTPDPAQPGPTCASATIGAPDGAPEILYGAGGIDVGGVLDVGRVYVLDGRTLAVLKRIDMPPADRALIAARVAENPSIAAQVRGGLGRTAVSPRGLPPCDGNAGVGACPTQAQVPAAVRNGDLDGGGVPDVILGANNFPETGATAHPDSHCARTAGTSTCVAAGRTYVYRGEDIAGTNPAVNLETPQRTLKNIAAQTDDPFSSKRGENFGHSQMEVGDVGTCRSGGAFPVAVAGDRCVSSASSIVPDGRPDYVVIAQRADTPIFDPDPANFEVGVAFLYDGATGAILYTYNHPEPVANALFGFTTGQQFALGDLGDSPLPDVVLAAFQNSKGKAQAGKAYVFSGNFQQNFINFAVMEDPTPNTFGRFGNPTEGVGELVTAPPGNEVLIGQFSSVQTAGKADTKFDVSFFNPANEQALQTISDPADQPESQFGFAVMPLGDLNGDGFLDFGVNSPNYDLPATGGNPAVVDQGRIYIFRSDRNAVAAPAPGGPGAGPTGPAGPAGAPGPAGSPAGGSGPGGPYTLPVPAVVAAGRTVDLDASRSKLKRGARLRLRGVVEAFANPAACEAGQSVALQRRAPSGGRFATFRTVKTDGKGAFSTRFKVTKSQLYRARVSQTESCLGAQSPRVLVKVVKPKKKKSKKKSAKTSEALSARR